MKAPRRLLEDPGASAGLRSELAQLEAARLPYDSEAGLRALQRTLDSAAQLPSAATASGASVGPFMLKLVLVAAIGGGGAALGMRWLSEPEQQPKAPAASAPAALPVTPSLAQPAAAAPESLPIAREVEKPEQDGSRREIAQLIRIRALLERDPAAAQRAIAIAQREFPEGILREEREGLLAIALARSGDERRARAQAERFIARYPKSPLRPRLELLLAGETP